jgi:hypothetical protein
MYVHVFIQCPELIKVVCKDTCRKIKMSRKINSKIKSRKNQIKNQKENVLLQELCWEHGSSEHIPSRQSHEFKP